MMGINTRVQDMCRKEGVMFADVWGHFNRDRSLYGKDGLQLSSVGKARLGRVLDESVREEIKRNMVKVQERQRVGTDSSQVRSRDEEDGGVVIVEETTQESVMSGLESSSVATTTRPLNA